MLFTFEGKGCFVDSVRNGEGKFTTTMVCLRDSILEHVCSNSHGDSVKAELEPTDQGLPLNSTNLMPPRSRA